MNKRMDRPKKEKYKFIYVYISFVLDGNLQLRTTKFHTIHFCDKRDTEKAKEKIAKQIYTNHDYIIAQVFPALEQKYIKNSQMNIRFDVF